MVRLPRWTKRAVDDEDKDMTIKQLKQLIANLPDDADVLIWDKDTANPIGSVATHKVNVADTPGLPARAVEPWVFDDWYRDEVPEAAFILHSLEQI